MSRAGLEGVDVGDVDAVVGLGRRGVEMVGGAGEERRGSHDQGHPRDGREAGPRGDGRDGRTHRVRYLRCGTGGRRPLVGTARGRRDRINRLHSGAWRRATGRAGRRVHHARGAGRVRQVEPCSRSATALARRRLRRRHDAGARLDAAGRAGPPPRPGHRAEDRPHRSRRRAPVRRVAGQHVEEVIRPGPRARRGRRLRPVRRLVARLPGGGLGGADGRAAGRAAVRDRRARAGPHGPAGPPRRGGPRAQVRGGHPVRGVPGPRLPRAGAGGVPRPSRPKSRGGTRSSTPRATPRAPSLAAAALAGGVAARLPDRGRRCPTPRGEPMRRSGAHATMSEAASTPAAVPGPRRTRPTRSSWPGWPPAGSRRSTRCTSEQDDGLRIARRITADDVLAEDVVQDAFLGAWRGADRYVAGAGSVKTWLLSIVHHRAIDAVRRRRPTRELPAEEEGRAMPEPLTMPDVWGEVSGRLDRDAGRRGRRDPARRPARGARARLLGRACRRRRSRSGSACRWDGEEPRPAGAGRPAPRARPPTSARRGRHDERTDLTCDEVRDLAPLFVTGALDPDEMDAVREHLADCDDAHAELLELAEAAGSRCSRRPSRSEPPASLKPRLMAAAEADLEEGRHPATADATAPAATGARPTGAHPAARAAQAPGPSSASGAAAALYAARRGGGGHRSRSSSAAQPRAPQRELDDRRGVPTGVDAGARPRRAARQRDRAACRRGRTVLRARASSGRTARWSSPFRGLRADARPEVDTAWAIAPTAAPVSMGDFTVGTDGVAASTSARLAADRRRRRPRAHAGAGAGAGPRRPVRWSRAASTPPGRRSSPRQRPAAKRGATPAAPRRSELSALQAWRPPLRRGAAGAPRARARGAAASVRPVLREPGDAGADA